MRPREIGETFQPLCKMMHVFHICIYVYKYSSQWVCLCVCLPAVHLKHLHLSELNSWPEWRMKMKWIMKDEQVGKEESKENKKNTWMPGFQFCWKRCGPWEHTLSGWTLNVLFYRFTVQCPAFISNNPCIYLCSYKLMSHNRITF